MGSVYLLFTQATFRAIPTVSSTLLTVMSVSNNFFTSLFLYPETSIMTILVMGGGALGISLALAYLIKQVYTKYCPDRPK